MLFEEIYKQYSKKIFRVCLGYFNDYDLAKDLTQETFIAVWENLDRFENRSAISTWIYRIATNKCLRHIEISKKFPKSELPNVLKTEDFDDDKELKLNKLHTYVSELPEIERIIISLSFEEISQEKIAEIVGISHANIRVKFHRIKEKLIQKFKEDERI